MTVLINAISARQGGGQTYLNNLLGHIPKNFKRKIYILDNQLLTADISTHQIESIVVPEAIVKNPFLRAYWEHFRLPRIISKLGVKVYFSPGGMLSLKGNEKLKTVTMCRNMLPFDVMQRKKYGFSYMRFRNWLLSILLKKSFEKADFVIFVSNYAKCIITNKFQTNIKKSTTIYHGIDPQFLSTPLLLPEYSGLPSQSYFLYVSTIDVYKAQIEVVKAFSIFLKNSVNRMKLVLVGSNYPPYLDQLNITIKALGVQDHVILLGKVPHEQLPNLYQHAKSNIFASECENCPNILLECLASGRPVLCSNRPPMDEFGEDRVQYFDPMKPQELDDLLLLSTENLAFISANEMQSEKNSTEIGLLYSWEKTAKTTWDLLETT